MTLFALCLESVIQYNIGCVKYYRKVKMERLTNLFKVCKETAERVSLRTIFIIALTTVTSAIQNAWFLPLPFHVSNLKNSAEIISFSFGLFEIGWFIFDCIIAVFPRRRMVIHVASLSGGIIAGVLGLFADSGPSVIIPVSMCFVGMASTITPIVALIPESDYKSTEVNSHAYSASRQISSAIFLVTSSKIYENLGWNAICYFTLILSVTAMATTVVAERFRIPYGGNATAANQQPQQNSSRPDQPQDRGDLSRANSQDPPPRNTNWPSRSRMATTVGKWMEEAKRIPKHIWCIILAFGAIGYLEGIYSAMTVHHFHHRWSVSPVSTSYFMVVTLLVPALLYSVATVKVSAKKQFLFVLFASGFSQAIFPWMPNPYMGAFVLSVYNVVKVGGYAAGYPIIKSSTSSENTVVRLNTSQSIVFALFFVLASFTSGLLYDLQQFIPFLLGGCLGIVLFTTCTIACYNHDKARTSLNSLFIAAIIAKRWKRRCKEKRIYLISKGYLYVGHGYGFRKVRMESLV